MTHTKTDEQVKIWNAAEKAATEYWYDEDPGSVNGDTRSGFIKGVDWREANPSPAVEGLLIALEDITILSKKAGSIFTDDTARQMAVDISKQALSAYEKEIK